MPYTLIPITRTYLNGSTPRTGTVRLQLVGPMSNGGEIASREPLVATLNSQGKITLSVRATNDPGTVPASGGCYEVTETLSGLATVTYFIEAPYDGGPIDLATAPRLGQAIPPAVMFQPVNQKNLPNGYAGLDGSGRIPHDHLPTDIGSGGGGGSATPISGDDTDIQPLGSRAAGSSGKAADARHVHPTPPLHQLQPPTASVNAGGQRLVNLHDGVEPTDAATVGQIGQSVLGWINVKDKAYGAKGDGSTNDTTAIQAAIDACPPGGVVYLPQGRYRTSAPLVVPPTITVRGAHASMTGGPDLADPMAFLQPLTTFTGTAMIVFKSQSAGGYAAVSAEQRIENLMLDGSTLDGTKPVDGIYAEGNVQHVRLSNVTISRMSNNGVITGGVSNAFPYAWRLTNVLVDNCRGSGIVFTRMTDLTMIDCQATGCWNRGIVLSNVANSQVVGCRAEWNGSHGFHITGAWGNGTGSGGMLLASCSTDRNGGDGVRVDATGSTPVSVTNLVTRRDGRNNGGGGGSYAGLAVVGATVPVIGNTVTCYPGSDDDGSGANSPQYGVRLSGSSNVQLDNLYLHAAQQGLYNDGTNQSVTVGSLVTTVTGPTTAAVRTVRSSGDWVNARAAGAVGDGVTNDAPALQAAVNALAAAGGGTLYLPAGRYVLNAALTWASGVNLVGSGDRASILQSTNGNLDAITGTDISNVTIERVQLSGPGRGAGSAVRFTRFSAPATANITLRDVLIQSFGGDGVFMHALASSVLHRVRVRTCNGVGFHLQAPQDTILGGSSTSLTACSVEGCVVGGYWLDGMVYSSISSCAAQGMPFGYRLDSCRAVSVTGSGAEQCVTGLIVYGGNGAAVTGFYTEASDGTSVWLTNATSGVFLGGIVENLPGSGAVTCLKTDAGTFATAVGLIASKPNALNGTVNLLGQGDGSVTLAGRTVVPTAGTGARMGTATLVGGTVTVNTTAIQAGSVVMLTTQTPGGTVGALYVSARTAGTSFTISSNSSSDTSTVGWRILDQS
ncbi:glycosyl hydrolase family 28-related protein [Streptomyces sp. NPDC088752]|uniref:right-handed parallel beta-helix repeat-containing protein n=1 Tax=Streptomyces sp. NPDC088752 TaxID=3154963 RepID=UPI00343FE3A3